MSNKYKKGLKNEANSDRVRKMRYTEEELGIMKSTFAENEDGLQALRKWFLQMPLDAIDKSVIEAIQKQPETLRVIRKTFLPQLDPNAPRNQMIDLWLSLDIKEKSPEQAFPLIASRDLLISYLDNMLCKLEEKKTDYSFNFKSFVTGKIVASEAVSLYINISMRNTLITHTEQMLMQLQVLAGLKDETVEQTQLRLLGNSNK